MKKRICTSSIRMFVFNRNNAKQKLVADYFPTQSAIICSKLTIETQEQGVKYVQS